MHFSEHLPRFTPGGVLKNKEIKKLKTMTKLGHYRLAVNPFLVMDILGKYFAWTYGGCRGFLRSIGRKINSYKHQTITKLLVMPNHDPMMKVGQVQLSYTIVG